MSVKPDLFGSIFTLVIFVGFPGYLEYRAIKTLREHLATARRTGKVQGHILWAVGLVLFFALLPLIVVLSMMRSRLASVATSIAVMVMVLIVVGMFIGNQHIGRIRKHRRPRITADDSARTRKDPD